MCECVCFHVHVYCHCTTYRVGFLGLGNTHNIILMPNLFIYVYISYLFYVEMTIIGIKIQAF